MEFYAGPVKGLSSVGLIFFRVSSEKTVVCFGKGKIPSLLIPVMGYTFGPLLKECCTIHKAQRTKL